MEKYNYRENIKEDIKNYIKENFNNLEEVDKESLYDDLFIEDCVTGNASGSYTFSTYQAEEYICHNMDILKEALEEFGYLPIKGTAEGAEWCDVTIRCYLLGECLEEAYEELESEGF